MQSQAPPEVFSIIIAERIIMPANKEPIGLGIRTDLLNIQILTSSENSRVHYLYIGKVRVAHIIEAILSDAAFIYFEDGTLKRCTNMHEAILHIRTLMEDSSPI
jgi:hypothetical protein